MASIVEILAVILEAKFGRDVRQAIHDGIEQCYEDGKAGVNDLQARQMIERVIEVNDQQSVDLAGLTARVEELEGGGGGGSSSGSTTTEVPTVIFDYGYEDFSKVDYGTSVRHSITFKKTFTEAPAVIAGITFRGNPNAKYGQIVAAPVNSSITTTGFDLTVGNRVGTGETVSPTVIWIAMQPTTVEVNTEIIVPATDDLTEAQIQSLINLLN